ncbi:MAG: methyltransferase domain-containing protein [Alphaproteobacteria bacterium]
MTKGRRTGATPTSTNDTLLGGAVTLRQPADDYRVAIDPVLLAAAVPARDGDRVLDVGTGVGAAALCLARRVADCRVVGIELRPELVALARLNIADNGFAERVEAVEGDFSAPPESLASGGFDHVMVNPPHLTALASRMPRSAGKRAAQVEGADGLGTWVDFSLAMVRRRGTVTVVHRADRLDDIVAAFAGRAGGLVVFPLWPKAGRPAKRVLLRWRHGVATPARLAPGLVLHEADGGYSAAAERVLRRAAALEI